MSPGRIEELFDCLEQKTSFQCSKQSDHPLAYLVEGDIELLGEFHPISISATYFGPRDKMVLYMHVCDGSYGAKSYLISELLMRTNAILGEGSFATWHDNSDIVFKKVIDNAKKLSCTKFVKHINDCVSLYTVMRPKLELFAQGWGLVKLTDEKVEEIKQQISWELQGIQRDLPF